ncbi:MAG: WD40 repeat domain-containing serine/threonine-protein kinase [Pirellulaceae bacterium]|nr:WD40 repeat domain-containing serine/threonine-protein kinase [Pirellulaceae bacterium]
MLGSSTLGSLPLPSASSFEPLTALPGQPALAGSDERARGDTTPPASDEPPTLSLAPGNTQSFAIAAPDASPTLSTPGDCVLESQPRPAAHRPHPDGLADYDILQEIARGGMGVVYRAHQKSLDRIVALKTIRAGELADAEDIARFLAEAEAAARLRHPHIVGVYEVGRGGPQGQPYFTMDYVAGPSLLALVHRQPLAAALAARYVAQVARAVQFAHDHGVLHRDLKPSNILIGDDDQPRVTDFGLAKRIDRDSQLTIAGAVLGTPSYMPPEQAAGEIDRVTVASDIYSLGAVLYECLTGRPPFVAATIVDVLSQVMHDEPVPPSRLHPKLPRDLETICLKCLEKAPARRYPSAAALADDLERFLRDEPIAARPVGPVERAIKWARRRPAFAGLVAVSAAALVIVVSLIGIYNRSLSHTNASLAQANSQLSEAIVDANEQRQVAKDKGDLAEQRFRSLRRATYGTLLQQASANWHDDPPNLPRAAELLDSLLPTGDEEDLRGFEWYFLRRLCRHEERLIRSGDGRIVALCQHEDGELLVSRESTNAQHVLSRYRGRKLVASPALSSADGTTTFCFAPRGTHCAAVLLNGAIELRDWRQPGETLAEIAPAGNLDVRAGMSADGALVAWTANDKPLTIWSVRDRQPLASMPIDVQLPLGVQMSADGAWAAVLAPSQCLLARVATREVRSFAIPPKGKLGAMAFSPDNSKFAVAFSGGEVDVYALPSGKRQFSYNLLKQRIYATCMTFLPDSQRLVIGSHNSLLIEFNLAQSAAHIHRGHTDGVLCLATTKGANRIFSGSRNGEVLEWDLSIEDQRAEVIRDRSPRGDAMAFAALAWSPDGKRLAAGGRSLRFDDGPPYGMVLLIDGQTRQVARRIETPEPTSACAFSPDGTRLLYGRSDGDASPFHQWDLTNDAPAADVPFPGGAFAACFAADGRVVLGGNDARLHVVDAAGTDTPWQADADYPRGGTRRVGGLVATPDGKHLLSWGEGAAIRLWDGTTGREQLRSVGHQGRTPVTLSANGRYAAWTTPSPELVRIERRGGLVASPETQLDRPFLPHERAIVFDIRERRIVFVVAGHAAAVEALALSADGRRLASGDSIGNIKLWDVASGNELISFSAHINGIRALAFDPAGRQLASIGSDGTLRIWRGD